MTPPEMVASLSKVLIGYKSGDEGLMKSVERIIDIMQSTIDTILDSVQNKQS